MRVLGVSCFFHDAAACLMVDGQVSAAAEEERFSRRKHDASFPRQAITWCLESTDTRSDQVDYVVFYEKPLRKLERILASAVDGAPASLSFFVQAMQAWLGEKLWVQAYLREVAPRAKVLYGEHHLSHAASAYYLSPFEDAAIVTADGVGEWATATLGVGEGSRIRLLKELRFPHSLGLLYSALTAYLGFEVNEGEYKVMGMAAYGRPRQIDLLKKLAEIGPDGAFRVRRGYFRYPTSTRVWSAALEELLGPPRVPESEITDRHLDLAASLQALTEDAVVALAVEARAITGSDRLALAGGVALNVLANRQILRRSGFKRLYVPPGPGDSGAAIGAAAHVTHALLGLPRRGALPSAQLGPSYDAATVRAFLEHDAIPFHDLPEEELLDRVARLIGAGRVVGWFCGGMEFGPRALGGRSILANAADAGMKDTVNLKVKHREPFRPFGPSVLAEAAADLFVDGEESPYMMLVTEALPATRSRLPAVVHVDGTTRVQTVSSATRTPYRRLLERVGAVTGVPAVLNTSFNVRGEPIVRTPEDAFRCFCATEIDALVLWPYLVMADAKRPSAAPPSLPRRDGAWLA